VPASDWLSRCLESFAAEDRQPEHDRPSGDKGMASQRPIKRRVQQLRESGVGQAQTVQLLIGPLARASCSSGAQLDGSPIHWSIVQMSIRKSTPCTCWTLTEWVQPERAASARSVSDSFAGSTSWTTSTRRCTRHRWIRSGPSQIALNEASGIHTVWNRPSSGAPEDGHSRMVLVGDGKPSTGDRSQGPNPKFGFRVSRDGTYGQALTRRRHRCHCPGWSFTARRAGRFQDLPVPPSHGRPRAERVFISPG